MHRTSTRDFQKATVLLGCQVAFEVNLCIDPIKEALFSSRNFRSRKRAT
jgi:hypothetical protein